MRIRAFQAIRPEPAVAGKLACLPYDVMSADEARAMAAGNPISFLHVERAEIDLPKDVDPYSEAVYAKAKENLEKLQRDGHLKRDAEPCLYLYQQQMGAHKQRGITAACHIEDYEKDIIKKHEKTRVEKENDRLRLNKTLRAQPGLVFLTYRDLPAINQKMDEVASRQPLYDFTAEDGVRHTAWRIPGSEAAELVKAFGTVPVAYVADGHHRSASAFRAGKEMREANPNHTGEEDYNYFPAVIFPASQLRILPYNRLVFDLNGLTPDAFLAKLKGVCRVTENAPASPAKPGQVSLYLGKRWYGLEFEINPKADPISRLDATLLQDKVLSPILGITDPRTSKRIDFVGGIRGTAELIKRTDSGEAAAAFSMHPVTLDQLMEISDAGQIMPPKSTWFEPKLRSGLFVYTF